MSIPFDPARPELWHPAWCDPERCKATDRTEPYHWSAPVVVEAHAVLGWRITAALWKAADEPPTELTAALFLVFEEQAPLFGARFVLDVADVQAVNLIAGLAPLVGHLAEQIATRTGAR